MKKYDLEQRTFEFSRQLLSSLRKTKINPYNESIIRQVIRSGTSIGANYREANGAITKKDFRLKISYCKKEAKETEYWLDLLTDCIDRESLEEISDECHQLILIFSKILKSSK